MSLKSAIVKLPILTMLAKRHKTQPTSPARIIKNMESREPPKADNPCRCSSHDKPSKGWKLARQLAGWALLALGVIGLIMPIMPGWVFIVWGVLILAPDVPILGRLLDHLARRVPALRSTFERMRGH